MSLSRREGGQTNTAMALDSMAAMFTEENGDRPNVPNVALFVTDGHSSDRMVGSLSM